MTYIYLPKVKEVPEGATIEERKRMFEEYKQELIKYNPNSFNADGSVKTFWQVLKSTFINVSPKQL